jgi:hypothetical protein
MERYRAYQHIIRISHADESMLESAAAEIATVTAARWGMDGANITFGRGLWKGDIEFGATIEIVTRDSLTNEHMQNLRNHVTAMGLTAFVTVNETTAFELY